MNALPARCVIDCKTVLHPHYPLILVKSCKDQKSNRCRRTFFKTFNNSILQHCKRHVISEKLDNVKYEWACTWAFLPYDPSLSRAKRKAQCKWAVQWQIALEPDKKFCYDRGTTSFRIGSRSQTASVMWSLFWY